MRKSSVCTGIILQIPLIRKTFADDSRYARGDRLLNHRGRTGTDMWKFFVNSLRCFRVDEKFRRQIYLLFVTGLYFLAGGIVLILRSSLGTTPISSVNYVLSLNSALTLGTWTFPVNMLLIAGQFWLIRDRMTRRDTIEILLQMPFSLLFGLFIDFNMTPTQHLQPQNYAAAKEKIIESGRAIAADDGNIRYLGTVDGRQVFEVLSGEYSFGF